MAATDSFSRFQVDGLDAPGINAVAVTPGTSDLAFVTRALYISVGGSVTVVMAGTAGGNGGTVSLGSVPVGTWLNIRVQRVTVASGAVAIW